MALSVKHISHPGVCWATAFGLGFLRPAPGTWGSIGALVFWWFFLSPLSANVQLAICVLYFLLSWWASAAVSRRFEVQDASEIVADEVVGMWLALALLPAVWWLAALAFGVFRLLDIAKPGPVGWLDREVKGGLGVMLDDVLAGLITACVLYFSIWGLQWLGFVQPML